MAAPSFSFDGTFTCGAALQRLLDRCPVLASSPALVSLPREVEELERRGDAGVADRVASALAQPFLHPDYTIPVVGCFRPVCRGIVDRAVDLLRRARGPLGPDCGDTGGEEVGEGDVEVIEFYLSRGCGLRLHELACFALSRALDLAPFLLRSVLSYFGFSPPPFQRLLTADSLPLLIEKDDDHLLNIVRLSFRFLQMEPEIFSKFWNWSCFLDLVQISANSRVGNIMVLFTSNITDIRWCAIQIISIILRISDNATRDFGLAAAEALACMLRWEEFCQDTALEKAGWYIQTVDTGAEGFVDAMLSSSLSPKPISTGSLVSTSTSFQGLTLTDCQEKKRSSCHANLESPFVLTNAVKKGSEMVLVAVSQKWPVLLYSPAGSGKTALISKLANIYQNQVLFIHMDEQMDSKTLIGSYVCSEQPGEFQWQPGSLTQAVMNGFWVVFEDIDKSPIEVQSILLPLLEGANSFVTVHGEAVNVAESFRLFATVSSSTPDIYHNAEGRCSFSSLWRKVMLGAASNKDLLDIITAWHPCLGPLSAKLVDTLESVNHLTSFRGRGTQIEVASSGISGRFSTRHLLKLCKRVMGLGIDLSGHALSTSDCKRIYQEAVDIFASSFSCAGERLTMMREIARIWGILDQEIERICLPNKPVIQDMHLELQVGRITLQRTTQVAYHPTRPFANLRSSLNVLEKIACSVKYNEPVLLVGETGTGKTTLVQNLAVRLGQPLTVLNLSQQSDASDLLGGFKPSDSRSICIPLYREFLELFQRTFSVQGNEELLRRCKSYRDKEDWKKLLGALGKCVKSTLDIFSKSKENGCGSKRKRSEELPKSWNCFSLKLESARKQISNSAYMSFSFVEGAFITALRNGHWVLLDEVNLAPQETLQRIIGVLDGENGTLCLAEKGDVDYVTRHPCFRIFCCMNPATDAGKRDLPHSFRSRFTEYFVDDILDDGDLSLFVSQYIDEMYSSREILNIIVQFYKMAKSCEDRLQDGANQKPQFSLRSLARALEYTKKAEKKFGIQRALYDGFSMFFVTSLDGPSAKIMRDMIRSSLLGGIIPRDVPFDGYLDNSSQNFSVDNYVLTASVKDQLRNLARAVYIKRYPVLLQGPTSSGKTSLVQYLASISRHKFVRINNHEHTDLQEYFGSYITNSYGRLEFQEGVLVEAVRKGYWVVLDELNLAPSDVLEALNRLLDDNRELFVPDIQETVVAHPDFMLFATQNPPTLYAGRKMLSRAFRNRFLEIHVDEIPENELAEILEKRCKIPLSYAKKMVEVMKDLQLHRQKSKVFSGKHGFITPRDLFRWANRFRMFGTSYMDLAKDGYLLLAERLREECEKDVVQEILERRLRVKLLRQDLYKDSSDSINELQMHAGALGSTGNIIMTPSMWRLYFLVERCYKLREPVLLVGETGGGKTTVCQLLSGVLGSRLHILNCHQYTEASDFIGGFHPVRDRSRLANEYRSQIERARCSKIFLHFPLEKEVSFDIGEASSTISFLRGILDQHKQQKAHPDITQEDLRNFQLVIDALTHLQLKWQTIFLWEDGPLVQAMKSGDLFLVDEISLADDSVLERLNSVLEPERTLLLAEQGGSNLEKTVIAHQDFFILATMNPGGDYGKKELSPALRNRFTEIWVPSVSDIEELRLIASERFIKSELRFFVEPIIKFWEWFNKMETGRMLTVRDLLSWIAFVNETEENLGPVSAFLHGAFLILLDGLSLGTNISKNEVGRLRERCLGYLLEQLEQVDNVSLVSSQLSNMKIYGWGTGEKDADNPYYSCVRLHDLFGIHPFCITKGSRECKEGRFEFMAPTTCRNSLRLLRAMQLQRPVLLEGSPGVGKTSLVVALAEFSGHNVVRINLSEQTDMMDLLGSDLPVACDNGMEFAWSDGILLQALKNGSWVLLDELNLAPQSVLEGLNAILDHRAEVYIPELGATFKCPSSFRVFACQNPTSQGGGRKGLPKSFLNRFTKVYVDELGAEDYLFICQSVHPSVPTPLLSKLINFNSRLYEDTMLLHKYGQEGSPWEFNLRDVLRACQIIEGAPEKMKDTSFLTTLYIQRMRTAADRREVVRLYEEIFERKLLIKQTPRVQINPKFLAVGDVSIPRNYFQQTKVLKRQLNILPSFHQYLEAILHCVQHQWLCILVGPSSSGKSSLLHLVAQLTGNPLHELNLSSGTDVSELLGCFEQYNALNTCTGIFRQVERYMGEYCALRLQSSWESLLTERKSLISRWLALLATINDGSCMPSSHFAATWKSGDCSFLSLLVEIIDQLKLDLGNYHLPVSWSVEDLTRSLKAVLDLQKKIGNRPSANFEWVSGRLVKAIECGEWVVLDNANLCNPTVLDRINSLVEPNGFITVNERGLVDGNPVVLHAHPKFRMFITIDPKYGEISRAMRNRGVEIFMIEQNWLLDEETSHTCREREIVDVKRFLVNSGIPLCNMIETMSEAHMYAKHAGLRIGVRITLLEIRRWVQLFQQLLIGGNQPRWSLELSWEHTYVTSLGEAEGRDIVMHVRNSHLSEYKWSPWMGNSLCLPGGWPLPLNLTKFVWFSQEVAIKQNFMYLEFLGAQCASYELSIGNRKSSFLNSKDKLKSIMFPVSLLCQLLFPSNPDLQNSMCAKPLNFDLEMTKKMLSISFNWVIEQATGSDLELYIVLFKWYTVQLHPYCSFFKSFSAILDQELAHPIWNYIINSWRDIVLHHQVNVNQQFLPLLSDEMADAFGSTTASNVCMKRLHNSIRCVYILRITLEQWNAEKCYVCNAEGFHQTMFPVLESLRHLEEEVLSVISESSFFHDLFHIYSNLLEQHRSFWRHIISSDLKNSAMAWHFLVKEVLKFKKFFPVATNNLLERSMDLIGKSAWNLYISKPLLWMHGGHPYAPSSVDIFHKKHQILTLCSVVWPRKKFQELPLKDNHLMIDAVLSTNTELRYLAMQGICMSTFVIKADHGNNEIINHLVEIYQGLLRRTEHERSNLQRICLPRLGNLNLPVVRTLAATCCEFSAEILWGKLGLDCWLECLPLFDKSSLILDMELLQELSRSGFLDSHELFEGITKTSDLLQYALDFSLKYSSRPPTDFAPHQKILWILDAWTSLDYVLTRTANVVHEMWFHWHSSLWYPCSRLPRMQNILQANNDEDCLLVQPVRFAVLEQILRGTHPVSGYEVYNFKIRVTSRNLCQDAPPERDVLRFLLTAARSLFQQIIFTHRKSFEEAKFREIKAILHHLRENNKQNLLGLKALILSSSHSGLTSCMDSFIQPLIKELYSECMEEYVHTLGLAWVHLGLLRFHLLLNSCNADPSMKYAFRLSQITERISMLELEIKVRQECELLAGEGLSRGEQDERVCLLKKLEEERKKLQEKVVFRPNPADFENLKIYCYGFLGPQLKFPCNLMNINEVQNWQAKSAQFIHQLSEKYAAYVDIIQPLQVAVYEMKLGLTLIVSNVLENEYLLKVEQNRGMVLATIYSLMQFPRCLMCCADMKSNSTEFVCLDANASASSLAVNLNVLKKLITTISCPGEEKIRSHQLEASVHHIILADVAYSVGSSLIMDESSFSLLNEVFVHFAKLWFGMKFQVKMNKDVEDQPFKFRPRSFRVEDIIKMDLPSLTEVDSDREYACELEEMPAGGEFAQKDPPLEGKNLEEEWNLIPEDILKGMLHVHGQLFGSSTLFKYGAVFEITEKEKLQLFVGSYDIGAYIIKGLPTTISAALDEKLVVEQMLRVCLQSAGNMTWFQQSHTFNIYKDPNASVLSKMVEPLVVIQERVKYFLSEWLDHPVLQNILGVTEMLLSIPLDTPLSKALFGLESLLARAQTLQETCPKFSLADHLEPVYLLVYSWQKIELDSWHNLLDGVEEHYEINAGKLWFPLHSVLHRNLSGNVELDTMFTMERVEEFMETSSLGEFKKRLQLLLAFHGQFNTGISMNVYSSSHQKEILSILYNAFGYYSQFLPLVMKHMNAERGCKEEEIKNQIKLLKWEQPNTFLSIERFRVARHKLWKLIKKFNDVLQQPLMVFLNQEANIQNSGVSAWFKQKPSVEADKEPMPFPVEPTHFGVTERLLRHHSWKDKINLAFEASGVSRSSGYDGLQCKEFASPISLSLFSECEGILASTSKGWVSLEKIYRHATDFAHVWKHGTKSLKKRRSLTDLLKLLEASGLSRHRSLIAEIEARSNQLSTLLRQFSYDVRHLLLEDSDSSGEHISYPQMLNSGNSDLKWNTANQYYFKNVAMLQQLWQARLNFHKDLSLEQVNRAMSFIDHLIAIQQDQRSTLYALWEQFRKLKINFSSLESFGTGELSLSSDQHLLSKCMWNQKKLFDKLVTLSKDTSLLLRCIGNSHLNACHAVRVEAETISTFVDKYIQSFVKSKELLDKYLLHDCGIITTSVACEIPLIISKQMETFVMENFQIMCSFNDDLQNFRKSKAFGSSMVGLLLNHFTELIIKGKLVEKEFLSSLAAKECPMNFCQVDSSSKETFTDVDASFTKISVRTINMVKDAIQKLVLLSKEQTSIGDMSSDKITSWNAIFEKYISELQLGPICVSFCETIISAGNLLNHSGNKALEVCTKVESQLKHLYVFLDLFLSIVEAIILDFLAVHNAISEMTNMLAQIFALLFSEGFGDSKEQVDDTSPIPQDATGIGMGEGEGMNDVSDQIDDEGQLLGTSEKQNQGPESSEKVPSKSDNGIEMDDDFAADAFSVSEDSGDDDASESEDLNLESVMDQNVDGSQVVDEKLWDKEEEANSEKNMEKYELGSSVKETDPSDREFRGKEEASSDLNESGELTDEESERLSGKNENQNASDDEESSADAKMDESNAFEDSSGIQCNEQKRECEEAGVDEAEDSLALDGVDENMEDETNQSNTVEDHMDLKESGEAEKTEIDEGDKANADDIDMDNMGTTNELTDLQKFEPKIDSLLEKGSFEPVADSFAVDLNMMPETHLSDGNDLQRSFVPSGGLPSDVPRSELSLPDLTHGQMFAADKPKLQSSEDDSLSLQRPAANPYRSIGDALEEWKDRVKISDEKNQSDVPDNMADNIGDEYQFVSEMEKGSSQTLGPATSDQINQSIDRKDPAVDEHVNNEDDIEPMDIIKEEYGQEYIKRLETSMHRHKTNEQSVMQLPETGERTEAHLEGSLNDSLVDVSGNIVSFESSFICEEPFQASVLTADQSVRREVENAYDAMQHDSLVEWKRYERVTTRLSQELCEQLRLVMEPTLASKLQGDYKTGKRINMKKVIPYIASHFRKDKIWLRRTRPNKRDYQVVVAIDDSRSMSESHCGSFAIEALVAICRAMSQLEVGQFAVTSFGEKGNIRLLHDFDQPFTGETGSKIISSLSFKQDNTIRDEPVVDLLKYLDNMLDTAVTRARLPSGANPLKQLILIIADGRFQDKEKLRRCVRDILSKKRMLAFVLLDSPQESIMDLPEYSFTGGKFSCTKYMDSFPFPYYVVLRNIEALPRTVADLLRQWFQLMQSE